MTITNVKKCRNITHTLNQNEINIIIEYINKDIFKLIPTTTIILLTSFQWDCGS